MDLFEKTTEKIYVFEGKIINVRRDKAALHTGKPCIREVVEHNGGVCVAALTDNNELLFVRQFRYPYMEVVLELPAGNSKRAKIPSKQASVNLRKKQALLLKNMPTSVNFTLPPAMLTKSFICMQAGSLKMWVFTLMKTNFLKLKESL